MKRKRMFRLTAVFLAMMMCATAFSVTALALSLIHISEPTRH